MCVGGVRIEYNKLWTMDVFNANKWYGAVQKLTDTFETLKIVPVEDSNVSAVMLIQGIHYA